MPANHNKPRQNQWYILTLTALTMASSRALPLACMSVLFKEITEDMGLNLVQIGVIWGIMQLGGLLVMPMGGLLCDRLGVKRVIVISCFLSGLVGACRGISGSFFALAATSFLWGLLSATMPPTLSRGASLSATRQQQGIAQGLLAAGAGIGGVLSTLISATILSPLLDGWRNVLLLYGAISIIFGLLWLLTVIEPELVMPAEAAGPTSFRQAFSHVLHIRTVWFFGLTWLAVQGCTQGVTGFLPLYLRENGWTAAAADGTLATFHVMGILGVIPLTLLSDRLGSRKSSLLWISVPAIIAVGLLSVINNEIVWILIILCGIYSYMAAALISAMCMETKEIGTTYAGTAIGLVNAFANVGWFITPPIGNSLAAISFGLPFVFWAAVGVCGLITLSLLKETGWRASTILVWEEIDTRNEVK